MRHYQCDLCVFYEPYEWCRRHMNYLDCIHSCEFAQEQSNGIVLQVTEKYAKERKEPADKQQLDYAKRCVTGLRMLINAIDGKLNMDTILPIARKRLKQYDEMYPQSDTAKQYMNGGNE